MWVRVIGEATGIESGRVDAPGGVAEEVPGGKPLPKRLEKYGHPSMTALPSFDCVAHVVRLRGFFVFQR